MKDLCQHLFESIRIGGVEIKNRTALAPMGLGGLNNTDGSLGPRAIDYYIERIRGGVGLIITHACKVENEIDPLWQGMGFPVVTYTGIGPFTELAEVAHAFGAKIFVQLSAGFGRNAHPRPIA